MRRVLISGQVTAEFLNKPINIQLDEAGEEHPVIKRIVNAHLFDAPYEHRRRSHIIELVQQGLSGKAAKPRKS